MSGLMQAKYWIFRKWSQWKVYPSISHIVREGGTYDMHENIKNSQIFEHIKKIIKQQY